MFTGIFKDTSVRILITFMIALCVLSSLILPDWMQNNFMYGISRGLAILGLMLLWRTNLVSFGHALYYGFGAYAVALCQKYFGITDILLRFAIAVIAAGRFQHSSGAAPSALIFGRRLAPEIDQVSLCKFQLLASNSGL